MKHAVEAIKWLARNLGWKGRNAPRMIAFGPKKGFSEYTAFVLSSKNDGYYQTTLNKCSCPDFEFRRRADGDRCKHQQMLASYLGVK